MQDSSIEVKVITQEQALEAKKASITNQAMAIKLDPSVTEIQVDLDKATKLPYDKLTALGAAFASIPEAFRTTTQNVAVSSEGLFRITDEFGNALNSSILFEHGDGSGFLGSFKDASGLHQARLKPAGPQAAEVATSIPYDPTALFIAAALAEINKKLDAIQETQEQMFAYLRNQDKAKQRANLIALSEIANDYRFSWNNHDYRQNKRNLVQFIKKDADQAIIHHRAEIKGKLGRKGLVHVDNDVREKSKSIRSELEEYCLAVYLYGYASFLEVMLYENFDARYLQGTAGKIEERSNSYRELYTQAYNLVEEEANSSVRAMAIGGLSGAMWFLSKAIEATPIGDLTPIDEALGGASEGLAGFNKDIKHGMLRKLVDANSSDVRPFIEIIENVSRLHNEPSALMADREAIYVLPVNTGAVKALSA